MKKIIFKIVTIASISLLPGLLYSQTNTMKSEPSLYPAYAGYGLLLIVFLIFMGLFFYGKEEPKTSTAVVLQVKNMRQQNISSTEGAAIIDLRGLDLIYYLTITMVLMYIILFFLMV
jgi:hypothetical protein